MNTEIPVLEIREMRSKRSGVVLMFRSPLCRFAFPGKDILVDLLPGNREDILRIHFLAAPENHRTIQKTYQLHTRHLDDLILIGCFFNLVGSVQKQFRLIGILRGTSGNRLHPACQGTCQ